MSTIKALQELKEQLQENFIAMLDGHDEEFIDAICQVVVDTVNDKISKQ